MLKTFYIFILSVALIFAAGLAHAQTTGGNSITQDIWRIINGYIRPTSSTRNIQVPALSSAGNPCVTVGTTGIFATSTCGSGGSGTASGTPGNIQFAGSAGAFNANGLFTWSNANRQLGIGSTTPGHFRTDTGLEIEGLNAGLSLFNNRNPGAVNSDESFLAYGAIDAAGTVGKTASISAKWRTATAGAAAGVLRLNVTTNSGGTDNVSVRIFGDQGIDLFGSSDTTGPGANMLRVTGTVGIGTVPASKLHVYTTSNADGIELDGTTNPGYSLANAGSIKSYIGLSTASDGWITGSVANDTNLRSNGGNILFSTNSGSSAQMYLKNGGLSGFGTSSPWATLTVQDPATSTLVTNTFAFDVASSSGTSYLMVSHAGNIGIGTTTPAQPLVVVGSTTLTSLGAGCVNSTATGGLFSAACGGGGGISGGTLGYAAIFTSATTVAKGVILDNLTVAGINATSSTVSFNVQGTTTLDAFHVTSSTAASLFIVKSTGSVGIGTSSPSATLAVQGTSTAPTLDAFVVASSSTTRLFRVTSAGNATLSGAMTLGTGLTLTTGNINMTNSGVSINGNVGNGTANQNVLTLSQNGGTLNPTSGTDVAVAIQTGGWAPVSGNANYHMLQLAGTYNSTAAVTNGIVRQIYFNPAITALPDFRFLETSSTLITTLSTSTNTSFAYGFLLNPITIASASTSAFTLANASMLSVGAPIQGTQVLLSSSTAISITGSVLNASTTNGIGLYVQTSTGATNNYAALFMGGNVGVGTSAPTALLSIGGGTTAANGINLGDSLANLYRSSTGNIRTDGVLNVGAAGAAGTVQSGSTLNMICGSSCGVVISSSMGATGLNGVSMANQGNAFNWTSGNGSQLSVGSVSSAFTPSSGTGTFNIAQLISGIGQTGNSNGITRGLYVNPTFTSVYDYRAIETTSTQVTISNANPVSQIYSVLFNPSTYGTASTSVYTIATSSTLTIAGAPIASTTRNTILTSSIGLQIMPSALNASTTNGYGAYIMTPTGAINNYAAILMGGNVGIGSSSPTSNLVIQGASGQTGSLLVVASSTGTTVLSVSGATPTAGTAVFNVASTTGTSVLWVDFADKVGINTSTPAGDFQVTTVASNATTTAVFGKKGQSKGTCLVMFDQTGATNYIYINASNALTVTTNSAVCGATP